MKSVKNGSLFLKPENMESIEKTRGENPVYLVTMVSGKTHALAAADAAQFLPADKEEAKGKEEKVKQ